MPGKSAKANNRGSDFFGLFVSGKDKDFRTFKNATAWEAPGPLEATGGSVQTYGNYKSHTFASSGSFTVTKLGSAGYSNDVDVLVVAGGGGGGGRHAGGGGAGGFRTATRTISSVGPITVTVGAGGNGAAHSTGSSGETQGTNGGISDFIPVSYTHLTLPTTPYV